VHAALAEVVCAVPHQLHRLAELLRDRGGLERGIAEQVAPERAAALGDVGGHGGQGEPEDLRELLLCPDRRFQARPDLGRVAADIGYRAVGLERIARAEVERELLLERRGEQVHRAKAESDSLATQQDPWSPEPFQLPRDAGPSRDTSVWDDNRQTGEVPKS
jgi:hypothetical protein